MFGLISFAALIGLIWLEVTVFGIVGHEIGAVLTIIGVFVTAAIGIRLFRISGRATLQRMASSVSQGRAPLLDVADGAAIMVAAGLLLIPGYATDALGIIMFIPGLRTAIIVVLFTLFRGIIPKSGRHAGFQFNMGGFPPNHSQDQHSQYDQDSDLSSLDDGASNVTIEGEYKREDK